MGRLAGRLRGAAKSMPDGAMLVLLALALILAPACDVSATEEVSSGASAHAPDGDELAAAGAKLANPLGSLWALNFDLHPLQFFDGTAVSGGPKYGAGMNFQPVMPIPLYGTGENQAKLVTRPVVPIVFSQPVPTGGGEVRRVGGIGDIQLPFLYSPPESVSGSNLIIGAGPVALLPTATDNALGRDQWALGPAAVIGYKNKLLTAGVFPNYFWKVASAGQGRKPDVSQGSLLYFLVFNLPNAWQIGMNPTITYDNTASDGNKWTVPVGLYLGKTIRMGGTPVNIKFGFEYSVVKPDDFGQQGMFRIQLTPVIDSLITEPLFGD